MGAPQQLPGRARRAEARNHPGRPPAEWDANGNGTWDGFTPDCYFHTDEQGWDRAPDGRATGWRAYAYVPMPGLFWPTNGSAADAFIRLPEAYREDAAGKESEEVYSRNLAIVEAFIRRVDVPIPVTDERALGADLDGDGRLGQAVKVAFVWPPKDGKRLHYVGRAATLDPGRPVGRRRASFRAAPSFFTASVTSTSTPGTCGWHRA